MNDCTDLRDEKLLWLKWLLANACSFALSGVVFRLLTPILVLFGGMLGFMCSPLVLLMLLLQSPEDTPLPPFLVGGAFAGAFFGMLLGGLSALAQRYAFRSTTRLPDDWTSTSFGGGLIAGALIGVSAGLWIGTRDAPLTLGLPFDLIFRRTIGGLVLFAVFGLCSGFIIGVLQRRALWRQNRGAEHWPVVSAFGWGVCWMTIAVTGETVLRLGGVGADAVAIGVTLDTLRPVAGQHIAVIGSMMVLGSLSYSVITLLPLFKVTQTVSTDKRVEQWLPISRKQLIAFMIGLVIINCVVLFALDFWFQL